MPCLVDMAIPQKTLDHSETLEKLTLTVLWWETTGILNMTICVSTVSLWSTSLTASISTSSLKKSIADDYSRLISKTKSHDNPDPRITSGKSSEFPQASFSQAAVKSMR